MADPVNPALIDPNAPVKEVVPGSADDPFTRRDDGTSTPPSPAPSQPVAAADPVKPAAVTDQPAPANAQAKPATADGVLTEVKPDDTWTEEETAAFERLTTHLKGIEDTADARVRQIQSAADRRVAAIEQGIKSRDEQVENLSKQIRDLTINGLPEAERDKVRAQWDIEDRERALVAREASLEEFYTTLFRATLLTEFGDVPAITEEALTEFDTPEAMEMFCMEQKLAYLESGEAPTTTHPSKNGASAAPAEPAKPAPAASSAKTDLGGGGPAPEESQFDTGKGINSLLHNLKAMKPEVIQPRA